MRGCSWIMPKYPDPLSLPMGSLSACFGRGRGNVLLAQVGREAALSRIKPLEKLLLQCPR